MNTHRTSRIAIAAVGCLAFTAACGGSDDAATADEIIVIGDGAGGISDAGATAADTGAGATATGQSFASDEEQALAFADCMRSNGVDDWPDPTTAADGSIDLFAGQFGPGGNLPDEVGATSEAALESCAPIIEGASFLPGGDGGPDAETQDQFLEVSDCLRDLGYEVDDPDFGGGGGLPAGGPAAIFGDDFDINDPANADALNQCASVFAGGFGG